MIWNGLRCGINKVNGFQVNWVSNGLFAISYAFAGETVATESRYEGDAGSTTFVLLSPPMPPPLLVVVLVLDLDMEEIPGVNSLPF